MGRPEKIIEIEIALAPGLMPGQVVELGSDPFIILGTTHNLSVGGYASTKLRVAKPNWLWMARYKTRRFFRRAWLFITKPFRKRRRG